MQVKIDLLPILSWIALQLVHPCILSQDTNGNMDIDKFIGDYINEVERTVNPHSDRHVMKKRSTNMDIYKLQGVDLLVGFQEEFSLPVKFPNDLILFSLCPSGVKDEQTWFASALEAHWGNPSAYNLVLFKYQNGVWTEKDRVGVVGGVRLAAEQIGHSAYIMVAEHNSLETRGSTVVYLMDNETDTLQLKQRLDNRPTSDVTTWKWEDMESFAAVAVFENEPGSEKRYSTLSPVYRWEGSNWTMIQYLPTYNPRALAQFTIGSSMFIAVANFQNDKGETTVDSEIFRFDLPTNEISLYQKLPTEAAVDIKYFCYQSAQITDSFLVYASAFHTDEDGRIDYNAASVVYKLSDEGYFIPFQALRVPKITSWQPVRSVKNNQESLVLLAALDQGIASFQYDGWRFVHTGVTYDRTSFGPGAKRINVAYFYGEPLISVANKESRGFGSNVFSPVLSQDRGLEAVQREVAVWEQRMSQQLAAAGAKMAALLQTARCAPTVNDPIVNLGSKVTFMDAEIDTIETFTTKVGEDDMNTQVIRQLYELNSKLEIVQRDLKTVKEKVDQTTLPELTIYKDVSMPEADFQCVHACQTDELHVVQVNGENLNDFRGNTVDIKGPVEFEQDITFDNLALIDPLEAATINGHPSTSVVDWSKEVYLQHGLKVEGDIIIMKNLSVGGLLDGVAINLESAVEHKEAGKTVVTSPGKHLGSLSVSELTLSDGLLSGVNFEHFQKMTLKTHGDQTFTERQDFETLEVDEVLESRSDSKVDAPSPHSTCGDGKPCNDAENILHENILRDKAARSNDNIEAISFVDNEITITRDFTIYGSVVIQNGCLLARDLVDLKHNITATRLMESGIQLDQAVINDHFNFHSGFEATNLNVDSVNGINVSSFGVVDPDNAEPLVVPARKEFRGGLAVQGTLHVSGTVNGVNVSKFLETLSGSSTVQFDNLTIHSLNCSDVEVGSSDWKNVVWEDQDGVVFLEDLRVEESATVNSLQLEGPINGLHLESLLRDTVFNDGKLYTITGKKHFSNDLNITKLTLKKSLNDFDVSNLTIDTFWERQLSQAELVRVDHLAYTGYLDGIEANEFGEWMMTEGDQTVMGHQTIHSLTADNAVIHTINSVSFEKLLSEAVFTFDNATLNVAVFEKRVEAPVLKVGERLQGLKVPEDLLLVEGRGSQQVSAGKTFLGNVMVHGTFRPMGISHLCQALSSPGTHVVITGNASFQTEPNVSISVNNKTWTDLLEHVWFKEDNITISSPIHISTAELNDLVVENINNNNVTESLSELVSLSQDGTINGTFFFSKVKMVRGLEAGRATVGGRVQGLQLQSFMDNVMLDGVDQDITGVPDFNHLIVDGVLVTDGLVNSLNLSTDVMLNNVASNTVTAPLTLTSLTVQHLTVPAGSLVAGLDILRLVHTAARRTGPVDITGDLVFHGQLDTAGGIRVEGFVNNMTFDKNHVMLVGAAQRVTGVKTFSPSSQLSVDNLTVGGHLNGINVTDFYSQQITSSASANISISGAKRFLSPLYSERAVLPEDYQGHNLTLLESQLAFPLPWEEYHSQLAALQSVRELAELSLAGRSYYMANISRVQDIEGSVFPLKSANATLLGAITLVGNKTALSLLHWSDEHNMFKDKPGSLIYFLKEAPHSIQSVALPGGEMAVYLTRHNPNSTAEPVKYGEMLLLKGDQLRQNKIMDGRPNSKLLPFQYLNRTCFVVVADVCRVYCPLKETQRHRLPSFPCQNITEVCVLATARAVYLVGLQTDSLVVWKLQAKRFVVLCVERQFHAVSVAASSAVLGVGGPTIAVANKHRVGSSRPETVDVYRLDEVTGRLSLKQQLATISPKQIVFAELPSRESVLYVTTNNPATPLEVFIYRGLLGYRLLAVEMTLPRPTDLTSFTDHRRRHFILVSSEGKAQLLQARFQGAS